MKTEINWRLSLFILGYLLFIGGLILANKIQDNELSLFVGGSISLFGLFLYIKTSTDAMNGYEEALKKSFKTRKRRTKNKPKAL